MQLNALLGLCRCRQHADRYAPRAQNASRSWYFLPPEHVAEDLLCGVCAQSDGRSLHGGLVLSEESRKERTVLFKAFGGYRLSAEMGKHLEKIWPKS
jgi:hypothetical protein